MNVLPSCSPVPSGGREPTDQPFSGRCEPPDNQTARPPTSKPTPPIPRSSDPNLSKLRKETKEPGREAKHFLLPHLSLLPTVWEGRYLVKWSQKSLSRGLGVSGESGHQRAPQSQTTSILSMLERWLPRIPAELTGPSTLTSRCTSNTSWME